MWHEGDNAVLGYIAMEAEAEGKLEGFRDHTMGFMNVLRWMLRSVSIGYGKIRTPME